MYTSVPCLKTRCVPSWFPDRDGSERLWDSASNRTIQKSSALAVGSDPLWCEQQLQFFAYNRQSSPKAKSISLDILDVLESNEQTLNNIFRGWRAIAYFCMDKGWIEPRTIHVKEIEPTIREVYTDSEIQKLLEKPNPEKFLDYRNWEIGRASCRERVYLCV